MVSNFRVGTGYDIHKLVEGRRLVLGGVEIEFEKGLLGHSDADAVLHAICDALLGAAALGDIGSHFPDNDPGYKDASSSILLESVVKLLKEKKYLIGNVDITIHAEKPKMKLYIEKMRRRVAEILGIEFDAVSVKAKTNEGLDSVGRGEAIAATAVALIFRQ